MLPVHEHHVPCVPLLTLCNPPTQTVVLQNCAISNIVDCILLSGAAGMLQDLQCLCWWLLPVRC
jgi:hypothetical protein